MHVALQAADRGLRQPHAPEPEEVAQRGPERLVGLEVDDAGRVVRVQPGLDLAALVDADVRGDRDEQAVVVDVQQGVEAEIFSRPGCGSPSARMRAATVAGSIGHGGLVVRPSATVPASGGDDDDPHAATARASSASTRSRGRRTGPPTVAPRGWMIAGWTTRCASTRRPPGRRRRPVAHGRGVARRAAARWRSPTGRTGARGERWTGAASASFPCGTALGATWDPDARARGRRALGGRGAAQGRARAARADGQHPPPSARGPQLRVLLRGPVAHGAMRASRYITGVQSEGVGVHGEALRRATTPSSSA